ncbi:hypothetical protein FNH05_36855 [Amycolatopsis rhizosphaerae]|uniref:HSP18 transcriptional regulator n=1 Tax=Amycolatopsis rhizosphaerae TaxID=2053003 RepID=A0A557ZV20_9PSEU|nr:hypothetical protein [Amycolatopsis rhizosphaerae]TVT15862.1 hypothetical protein FNH05_36855 [Amycolatopsis rhizosphaerae]
MEDVRAALELVHSVLTEATRGSETDPRRVLAALTVLRGLREELSEWEPHLIASARREGISWAELAPALGVASRQAAERRYLRLRDAAASEVTADERVQATRDRRAGERAVTRWARENSADLRRLAGQVSAVPDLPKAESLRRALGEDDATALIQALAAVQLHLTPTHPALAAEIGTVTEHADRLRRETHERRQSSRSPHP